MTEPIEPLKELARRWREDAQKAVPSEYADRQMHGKYLRLDNAAAGMDDCADELESLLPALEGAFARATVKCCHICGERIEGAALQAHEKCDSEEIGNLERLRRTGISLNTFECQRIAANRAKVKP